VRVAVSILGKNIWYYLLCLFVCNRPFPRLNFKVNILSKCPSPTILSSPPLPSLPNKLASINPATFHRDLFYHKNRCGSCRQGTRTTCIANFTCAYLSLRWGSTERIAFSLTVLFDRFVMSLGFRPSQLKATKSFTALWMLRTSASSNGTSPI